MNEGSSTTGPSPDRAAPRDFRDVGQYLESLETEAQAFYKAQRDLLEAQAYHRVAKVLGGLLSGLLTAVLLLGLLVFLSIALALWLGHVLGSPALGFLCIGGVFLLAFLIFRISWQGGMKERFTLNLINELYDEKD